MSTEENEAVVRRWWETWWETAITMNLHVFDALIDEVIADKWVYHYMARPVEVRSHESTKEIVRNIVSREHAHRGTIEDVTAQGDCVAVRGSFAFTETFTGKLRHTLFVEFNHFVGGKIAETWHLQVPAD
jgi:hypothetical protein